MGNNSIYTGALLKHISDKNIPIEEMFKRVRLHGGSHRKILIPAALAGAVFLMLADILGRVVSPVRELPVGMVTAAVGCPVFLWLLNRSRAGS